MILSQNDDNSGDDVEDDKGRFEQYEYVDGGDDFRDGCLAK